MKNPLKSPKLFICDYCNYKCSNKKDYNKHLATAKHKMLTNANKKIPKNPQMNSGNKWVCDCGKIYKHSSTLYAHKKKCTSKKETNEPTDKELIMMLIKENSELKNLVIKVLENNTPNNTNSNNNNNNNNNHTNSHNKAFNLNFFLNETCKNAMNITDFVDSIKLQLNDLMEVGELGYVEGISKIIVKNLNNLDETERPVHCTDKKRETMYVKDQGEWNKEDDNKTNLRKAIIKVADKN